MAISFSGGRVTRYDSSRSGHTRRRLANRSAISSRRLTLELLEDRRLLSIEAPPGLVSWWPGDGSTFDVIGPNDGTLTGGTAFATGCVDEAFSFDGVDDMFQAPTDGLPTGNQNRTLELWVKFDTFPEDGDRHIAGYGNFGAGQQIYSLFVDIPNGNRIAFSQWGSAIWGPPLSPNRWYHVAVTNLGNQETLYLDGAVVASGSLPLNTPAGSQLYAVGIQRNPPLPPWTAWSMRYRSTIVHCLSGKSRPFIRLDPKESERTS